MKRYYVDGRGGCIAVRDKEKDIEFENGLHPDMDGVIAYWSGFSAKDSKGFVCWDVHPWQQQKANELAELLNLVK